MLAIRLRRESFGAAGINIYLMPTPPGRSTMAMVYSCVCAPIPQELTFPTFQIRSEFGVSDTTAHNTDSVMHIAQIKKPIELILEQKPRIGPTTSPTKHHIDVDGGAGSKHVSLTTSYKFRVGLRV